MRKLINYQDVLSRIILIWIACFGAITAQVVAGYFMNHVLLPYLGFLLIIMIVWLGNRNLQTHAINCSLLTHYTVYVLAVSGVVMLFANLMNTNFISNRYSEFSHQNFPFHASFIVYPVATILYGFALLRRGHPLYCQACRNFAEFSVEESMRRNVLHHEGKVQMRMAFGISLLMTAITYSYYFLFYINGTSFRKYSPDVFVLYILPAIVFVISVIYVLSRYFTIEMQVSLRTVKSDGSRLSHIRYMVVWQDRMLLRDVVSDDVASMWDTPCDYAIPFTETFSMFQAENLFKKAYGSSDFSLKRLFSTIHKAENCLHCAAFLDDEAEEVNSMGGEWFSLRELDMMLQMGAIARPFAIELHRVFTVTMAWKTYDRDGRRLYPIKNYRPTFRLRDFKDWTVDYDDKHWLYVAENNQDKPFYRFRRFWRKYIIGDNRKWEKEQS